MQTKLEGALWADNFERKFTDVLALQSDVAPRSPRNPGGIKPAGSHGTLAQPSVVPEAYEAYLKGRYEASKRTPEGSAPRWNFFNRPPTKIQPLPLLMRALP